VSPSQTTPTPVAPRHASNQARAPAAPSTPTANRNSNASLHTGTVTAFRRAPRPAGQTARGLFPVGNTPPRCLSTGLLVLAGGCCNPSDRISRLEAQLCSKEGRDRFNQVWSNITGNSQR